MFEHWTKNEICAIHEYFGYPIVLEKTFISALTELEIFEGKSGTQVNLAKADDAVDSGANAVGVSIVQVTSTGSVSDTAPTGVQLTEYKITEDEDDNSGRRVLEMDSRGLQDVEKVTVTIVLQNLRPFTYPSAAATEYVRDCDPLTGIAIEAICDNYNADTQLSYPTTRSLDCPAGKERRYTFTCPKYDFKPQCSIWDDVTQAYTIRDNCSVTAYDSMSTTCECEVDGVVANSARRRLDVDESGQSDSVTISSTTVGEEDGIFFESYEDIDDGSNDEDDEGGSEVFLAAVAIGGICFIVGAYLLTKEYICDPERKANEKRLTVTDKKFLALSLMRDMKISRSKNPSEQSSMAAMMAFAPKGGEPHPNRDPRINPKISRKTPRHQKSRRANGNMAVVFDDV